VALSGGIATGKSVCRARFEARGVPTIDADHLARAVVAPGTPGLAAVVALFGETVLGADGSLNRAAVAAIVFADASRRAALEVVIHPLVYAAIDAWFDHLPADARLGIADIPLLFETQRQGDFDVVIVAACPPGLQLARLMARDGLSAEQAQLRLDSQWPIDEKVRRADIVIDTAGTLDETMRHVDAALTRLLSA
jgi:dephospho-CoA kinase